MQGYVYVLMNAAFPSLLKIGRTTKLPQERANELSTTSSPEKFVVVHSVFTKDCVLLEQSLHKFFKDNRYNQNREFFEVSVNEVIKKIDELLEADNLQTDSSFQIESIETKEILLYQIFFHADNRMEQAAARLGILRSELDDSGNELFASRIGFLPTEEVYLINEGDFDLISRAEEYLASFNFKLNLSNYYKKLSNLQEPTNKRKSAILGLLASNLIKEGRYLAGFKISKVHKFKVRKSFFESIENTIINEIQKQNLEEFDIEILPDKQTMYFPLDCPIENISDSLGIFNSIYEIFYNEEEETLKEIKRKKSKNSQLKFYNLLKKADKEVVKHWELYLERNMSYSRGLDFVNEFGIDFSEEWENFHNLLLEDIKNNDLKKQFRDKL